MGQFPQHSQLTFLVLAVVGWASCFPSLVRPMFNKSVPFGTDVNFSCNTQDSDGEWVKWDKTDTGHIIAIETHVLIQDPRIYVSLDDNNTWYLHIQSVTAEDQGPYRCTVNNSPDISEIVFLEVFGAPEPAPPAVIHSSNNTTARERSTVTLWCNVTGYPKPIVTWTREDNKPIHLLVNDTSSTGKQQWKTLSEKSIIGEILHLPLISRTDAGAYRCTANNSLSPAAYEIIDLKVAYPPDKVSVSGPRQARVGDKVTFTCVVENSNPAAEVSWMVESRPRSSIAIQSKKTPRGGYDSVSTLSVTVPPAAGKTMMFTCAAVNKALGVMEVDTYILPILEPDPNTESNSIMDSSRGHQPETKYMTLDINPKRGLENDASSPSDGNGRGIRRRPSSPMRGAYFNMLTFLRFFGLLMAFH